jgi:hypothetical protein
VGSVKDSEERCLTGVGLEGYLRLGSLKDQDHRGHKNRFAQTMTEVV